MKLMISNVIIKKCRKAEYVQRRVRFVNVQVPCPHSIMYVKFFTGIFGGFGLPILSVLGWQSEADCGFGVELIVG